MATRILCAMATTARFESIVFLAKVTILLAGDGEGRLDQRRAQVRIARANGGLASFAGALVLPRTQAGPRSQMADRWPLAHLDAHLRNDGGSYHPINAGNAVEQLHLARIGFELGLQLRVHLLEVAIKSVEPVEL